ncbi:hypothetical protein [Halomonas sp. C05BenzN]|uniref:hypothetical protein n=1 Tax=Halomonas sp. C05BenzN TaxID=3411041 RepID=UPI003B9544A3
MKRCLLAATLAALTLAMSLPATADRPRHGGYGPQVHHHYHQHDYHQHDYHQHDYHQHDYHQHGYRADRGRHHRKHWHKPKRRHRSGPPRVVEHHYYSAPPRHRHYRERHYRGHTDIPLVSVDGYPLLRIQVNH